MAEQTLEKLITVVQAADDRMGQDIIVMDVRELTPLADYYLVTHANNDRQLNAVIQSIVDACDEAGYELTIEGKGGGRWVLLDLGDIIANVFQAEARSEYNLEGLWSEADRLDLSPWIEVQ